MVSALTARPRIALVPRPADAGLAVMLAVAAVVEIVVSPPPEPAGVATVVALAATLPLAWRSTLPVAAALVPSAAVLLSTAVGSADSQPTITTFAPLIGVFALGEHASRRALAFAGPVCVLMWAATGIVGGDAGHTLLGGLGSVTTIAVGRAARSMVFETEVLEAKVDTLEQEQDARTRAAVAQERTRIARELHDVIGHSISLMGIQAGAVRRVLPPVLDRERELLLAIEHTGRDSVAEMRRLIELLRGTDEPQGTALPTLSRVGELVADLRRAGLAVDLTVSGDVESLSPGRALAAYRIVQEALTNALKHAPGGRVEVAIARTGGAVTIDVHGEPEPAGPQPSPGKGQGLIGMRERVALYDGTFAAGPTPEGGFRVHASLPGAVE
jgi:signal transduction histidine kinase